MTANPAENLSPQAVEAYVKQTAALLGLTLPPEMLPSVVENFEQVMAIAQPVLAFDLPDDIEPAFIFEP